MEKEEKWEYTKSVKYLPPKIRKYFLDEARTMYHALSTAEVQIVENKTSRRPGHYGERCFVVVSSNPKWYRNLYFSQKSKTKLSKKGKAERELKSIRRAIIESEKSGKAIDLTKKEKKEEKLF